MNVATVFHPDALPSFGTPEYPVALTRSPGESVAGFEKRVAAMAAHLESRSGVSNYIVRFWK